MNARAITLFDEGNRAFGEGRHDAAERAFAACLALVPGHADAAFNRGNALMMAGRLTEAVEAYLACLRAAPDYGAAFGAMSEALRGLGQLDHARIMAQEALARLPRNLDALVCLAGRHFDLGEFNDAARLYGEALALDPLHAGVMNNLANALHCMGQLDAALVMHERCYRMEPDNAAYRYNRAMTMLAAGDYRRGWAEHEWRKRRAPSGGRAGSPWRGDALAGRRLLLLGEQGLGDTLQFARYAPLAAERGAHVVLEVQPGLERLLRSVRGVAEVVRRGEPAPPTDFYCPLMSLPWLFGTTLETVPGAVPYLAAPESVARAWQARLGRSGAETRVGLAWAGGAHMDDMDNHFMDRRRSIPPSLLAPLGRVPGARLFSLQKDQPPSPEPEMFDFMPAAADFADTAALVAQLDLVITVDTSVAHLAGAMGKPVWLLNRFDSCWRWQRDRSDSPWYPTMRIYRQTVPGHWAEVIERVARDLAARIGTPRAETNRADIAATADTGVAGTGVAPSVTAEIAGSGNARAIRVMTGLPV